MSSYPTLPYQALPEFASGHVTSRVSMASPPLTLTGDLPRRPYPINLALGVMIATSVLGMICAVLAVGSLHHFNATFRPAVGPIGASPHFVGEIESVVRGGLATMAMSAATISAVLGVLATGVAHGNRGARVGAWALCALGVGCSIGSLLIFVAARSSTPTGPSSETAGSVVEAAREAIPAWFPGVASMLALLQAFGFLSAAIMLAAPSAGAFFGRVMRPWRPEG